MTYEAIDCQGFAGGFTLGTVQAGFKLVGKREHPGGFGIVSCEGNRHLLGDGWQAQASVAEEWEPRQVPFVFGNPPCSGFSLLSASHFRGPDSPINSCMWDFVGFASRCNPEIIAFESVSQAYNQGRDLMRGLRADLEERTGDRWDLTHVLHNAYSLGGVAIRRRYFFVAHRIPFGVEIPKLKRLPVLMDAISDLEGLGLTWERQTYRRPATWWSRSRRSKTHAVDGQVCKKDTPLWQRSLDLMRAVGWGPRENMALVCERYYAEHGDLPESFKNLSSYPKLIAQAPGPFMMGFNQMHRWEGDRPSRVITGASLDVAVHPYEDRRLTHREALRIMGYPDDWSIAGIRHATGLHALWGKGIPVDCGRWLSGWVRNSLDGNPGQAPTEEVGERERLVNCLSSWQSAPGAERFRR